MIEPRTAAIARRDIINRQEEVEICERDLQQVIASPASLHASEAVPNKKALRP